MRFAASICAVSLLALCACGGDDEETSDEGDVTQDETAEDEPPPPCVPRCAPHRSCEAGACVAEHPQVALAGEAACYLPASGQGARCWSTAASGVFARFDGVASEVAVGLAVELSDAPSTGPAARALATPVGCAIVGDVVRCDAHGVDTVADQVTLERPSNLAVGHRVCALEGEGDVACFPALTPELEVVRFEGVAHAQRLAASEAGLCVLLEDGGVGCTTDPSCASADCLERVDGIGGDDVAGVPSGEDAREIAVGLDGLGCAARIDGRLACWELDPEGDAAPGAVLLEGIEGAAHVALGATHGCLLGATGGARCFGAADLGQRGDGTMSLVARRAAPGLDELDEALGAPILEGGPLVTLAAGRGSGCAVTADGEPLCWGASEVLRARAPAHLEGALRRVPGVDDARTVAMGHDFGCALPEAPGEPVCWGRPSMNQVGGVVWAASREERVMWTPPPGATDGSPSPAERVPSGPTSSLGDGLTCTVDAAGLLACQNPRSALDAQLLGAARAAPALSQATSIGATICGLDAARDVVCVGALPHASAADALMGTARFFDPDTHEGRSLDPSGRPHLVYALGGLPASPRSLEGRGGALFALVEDGRVFQWRGEMGPRWQPVEGLSGVVSLTTTSERVCAAREAGLVHCRDLFGDGPPRAVPGMVGVRYLTGGFDTVCAAHEDGHVSCFGRGARGAIGTLRSATPQPLAVDALAPPR